jgi:hypothetical protein
MKSGAIPVYFSWYLNLKGKNQVCLSYVTSFDDMENIRDSQLRKYFLNKEDMRADLEAVGISDIVFIYPTLCTVTLRQLERLSMPIPVRYIDKNDGVASDAVISGPILARQIINGLPRYQNARVCEIKTESLPVVVEYER